jgi:phage terminase large subunit-like protein
MIMGRDGLEWEVLSLPAKCERPDDPLGRKVGDYIWPEWFPASHWKQFEEATGPEAARTWASLCQQRPTPQGSGRLDEKAIDYYKPGTQPPILSFVGAGDYAVSAGKNDFTELGVFGIDPSGDLWEVDWWHEQSDTGKSTEASLDMVARWKTPMWFNEGGVIDKAMGPLMNMRMRERSAKGANCFTDRRTLASGGDKLAKCQAFIARCNAGTVHFRDNANSRRIIGQIAALPAGRFDDAADVCGLIGRAIDQFPIAREHKPAAPPQALKPFSKKWLEYKPDAPEPVKYY